MPRGLYGYGDGPDGGEGGEGDGDGGGPGGGEGDGCGDGGGGGGGPGGGEGGEGTILLRGSSNMLVPLFHNIPHLSRPFINALVFRYIVCGEPLFKGLPFCYEREVLFVHFIQSV